MAYSKFPQLWSHCSQFRVLHNFLFQTIFTTFQDRIGTIAYEPFAKQIYFTSQFDKSISTKSIEHSATVRNLPGPMLQDFYLQKLM